MQFPGKTTALWNLLPALAFFLFSTSAFAAPGLIHIADVKRISVPNTATAPNQVEVQGIVTSTSGWKNSFFLEDQTGAISIDRTEDTPVSAGDEVVVRGSVKPGLFAPVILTTSVSVIGKATFPKALKPSYEDLSSGNYDSRRIEVQGVVRSAQVETVWGKTVLLLNLNVPGGSISVHVLDYAGIPLKSLVDATITLRGVCGTKFNDRSQIVGVRLFVPDASQLTIDTPAKDAAQMPLSKLEQLQRYLPGVDVRHRVKITGTLTYQSSQHGLYLEDDGAGIHLQTTQGNAFQLGDRLEALGFLHNSAYSPELRDAQLRRLGSSPEPIPIPVEATNIVTTKNGFRTTLYDGRLVRMTATVLEQIPNSQNQVWLMRRGNIVFQAELPGLSRANFEARSTVDMVGICMAEVDDNGFPISFRLLLRSPEDILVAESFYSKRAIFLLLTCLLLLLGGAVFLWHFERLYGPQTLTGQGPIHLQELLSRFQSASRLLPLLVLFLTVLGVPFLPRALVSDLAMPLSISAAVALSALSIFWNRSQTAWQHNCSSFCSLIVPVIACSPTSQRVDTHLVIGIYFCMFSFGMLLLRDRKLSSAAQMLFVALGSLSMLNLVARLYNASPSFGIARHTAMPASLAACLFLLSIAAICSRPDSGLIKTVSSQNLGGLVSRRLLPAAVLIPVFIGWVRLQGQLLGLYDTLWGLSFFAMANVISFGGIVWASGAMLNRLDAARSKVEEALRERDTRLEMLFEKSGIGDYTWNIREDRVRFHPIIRRLYGVRELENSDSADWFRTRQHPDDAALIAHAIKDALLNKHALDVEFRILLPDGSIRWICCRGSVVYDATGAPTHINGLNMDVTVRKTSEAALLKSIEAEHVADQQLQTGLKFAKVAIWWWTSSPDTVRWSGPVDEILGKSANDLSSYSQFREIIHFDDLAALEATLSECLSTGTEYRAQFRITIAGSTRWIAGQGDVLRDTSGQICGMSGVNFDITANKIAEQRLMESEHNFRQLADAMPQIVWICNPEGKATYFNHQWYIYTDTATVEDRYQAVHPDDLARVGEAWQSAFKTTSLFEYEIRLRRASDDTYRWHLSRALPIRDDNGRITQWFGTSTDIEFFKQTQIEIQLLNSNLERRVEERSGQLAESELRHRLLVEGVKDYAILLLDSQGQVKSWNQGAELLTGYKSADILGRHFSTFYNDGSVAAGEPEQSLMQATAEGRSYREGWRRRQNGSEFWASAATTSIWDVNAKLGGFSEVIRDMTEQRQAMSLLVAERQNAEHANQAKSNFLASVSHEIRTPMNAILGMADLLAETELDETQSEYVHRFQRAGSNLMAIINDLLDLSKIESGHFELEEVPFDLEEVAQRAVDLVAPKAHRNQVNLAFRIVPGIQHSFTGDPNRLQQILLNLLGNSAKFTQHGEIVLTIKQHSDGDVNHIQFEVADTGIGIPTAKLAAIFDDFTQAESSTTRRFGGTGLGLGIARRLAERMGGTLAVESEVEKGSIFTFDAFFRKGEDVLPGDDGKPEVEDLALRRILIVDTNSTNQLIYREMCASWSMRPEVTDSANEAIVLLEQAIQLSDPFSMILLHRFSVDLDAFEALPLLRAISPALPVILTTGQDQPGNATRAKSSGFSGYLLKPIRRSNLLQIIASSLARASASASRQDASRSANTSDEPTRPKMKILVADDSEDNRFLIEAYLKGTGYEPVFADNGKLAIEQFAAQPFDLVLMDMQMPLLDGLQATAAIRALERQVGHQPLPIIALTGNAMDEDIAKSEAVGCNAHLAKPISRKDLLSVLDEWRVLKEQAILRNFR